ncbi:MAG: protein phosphatase 2C domain-containing protein [Roseburia sp.]|nr:protein phosphatase 2C domain-containing protein [Roseburia sp.]MCM1241892.1 protein phosphatase 2C domain-containing protein [Roseburia sp.]
MGINMIINNLIIKDLSVWMAQTEQDTGEFSGYVGVRTSLLTGIGIAAGILLLWILFLLWRCRKLKKGQGAQTMASTGSLEIGAVETVRIGKLHEQGERSGQQDCFGVSDESLMQTHGLLAVVADGMGGLADGDKVSTAAVESILDQFLLYQGKGTPEQILLMLVQKAVESVNELLGAGGVGKSGSTLVMGLLRDSRLAFVSVGDSRICLYRHGLLMQLNREHIYRNKLALDAVNGETTLQDIYGDSRGSGLISFLGMGVIQYIDFPAEPLRVIPGDKLLFMSDGIYNALDHEELIRCLNAEPEEAAKRIQEAIQEKAYTNQDNYTAIIIGCY